MFGRLKITNFDKRFAGFEILTYHAENLTLIL